MQERLLILRKSRKITQKTIADYLGISTKAFGEKERGETNFTLDEMFALADYFKMGIEEVFIPRKKLPTNEKK